MTRSFSHALKILTGLLCMYSEGTLVVHNKGLCSTREWDRNDDPLARKYNRTFCTLRRPYHLPPLAQEQWVSKERLFSHVFLPYPADLGKHALVDEKRRNKAPRNDWPVCVWMIRQAVAGLGQARQRARSVPQNTELDRRSHASISLRCAHSYSNEPGCGLDNESMVMRKSCPLCAYGSRASLVRSLTHSIRSVSWHSSTYVLTLLPASFTHSLFLLAGSRKITGSA
jgi:hypothetical protein